MKGTTKWLMALAIFASLSGSAQAETYKVGGTRALLIQVSDFSAADLVINFSAKASSISQPRPVVWHPSCFMPSTQVQTM